VAAPTRSGRARLFAPLIATVVAAVVAGPACGRSKPSLLRPAQVIVVNAPFAAEPALADTMARGAELAVDEINRAGGVPVGNTKAKLTVRRADSGLSPATAAANIRQATADPFTVAVVDEGTGVDVAADDAAKAGLPIGVVYQGGESLIDRATRPALFRIAPTNRGVAFRLAEYLVPKGVRVAFIRDDGQYGAEGAASLDRAFARNRDSMAASLTVPASGADPAPQVLEARRSGATALVVWARPGALAAVVRAARSSGWDVPIFTSPTGEDPLVRQQLADHPEWLDGLTFTSARLTSEKGTAPFEHFRSAYESAFGPDRVGGISSAGRPVVQPPDWAMYPYDFVHVVAAAMTRSGHGAHSAQLLASMEQVEVNGANGDERSFNERNHEGVVDDDIFFAAFRSMIWSPVKDDPLSATLPVIPQTN
jgi:branched-chain amino acid transport system substrate-binding protein